MRKILPRITWPSALKALFSGSFESKLFFKKIKKRLHPLKILINFLALFLMEKGR